MTNTLKDLQKKIYSIDEEMVNLRIQKGDLRQKINDAQKDWRKIGKIPNLQNQAAAIATAIVNNEKKRQVIENHLESRLSALQEHIRYNEKKLNKIEKLLADKPKDQAILSMSFIFTQEAVQESKKVAQDEIKKASKEIAEHKSFIEQEKQKQEKIYREQKEKILHSLSHILENPEGLRGILSPLATNKGSEKKAKGIGRLDIVKAIRKGFIFAVSNAGSVIDIIDSRKFYTAEAKKMMHIVNQEEKYDPQNSPFFMRLLRDEEVRIFFKQQSSKIIYLVEVIAPLITPIILKELGKVDAIAEEVKNKAKALAALPAKEEELERLKNAGGEKHRKRIDKLEKKIISLKELKNRERIAKIIDKLKAQDLGNEFITKQLLPIIVETFKELLVKPEEVIDIANLAIDFVRDSDQANKTAALRKIFDKIDINRLLQNGKLAEFLQFQSAALSKAVTTVMEASPTVSAKMAEVGIDREAVVSAVQTFAPIVGEVLKVHDIKAMDRVKGVMVDIALSDLEEQKRKAESLEDVARLDKVQDYQKLEAVKALLNLSLGGDILFVVLRNIPEFLRKNQSTIENVIPKIWPMIIAKIDEELEKSLILYNPKLERAAIKKIILPQLELLKVIDPVLIQKLTPVIVNFVDALTNDISPKDVRFIYQYVTLLTSKTTSPKDKHLAQEKLISETLKLISSKKMTLALRTLGEFVSNSKNIPAITTIAKQAIEDNTTFKALQVPPYLLESTVPLVTAFVNGVLASGDQFAPIIKGFLQYKEGGQGSKEQNDSLVAMAAAGLNVTTNLIPMITGDLATYLHNNKQNLANIVINAASKHENKQDLGKIVINAASEHENKQDLDKIVINAVSAAKPFAMLIPPAIEIVANALPLTTDMAVVLLSKGDALAKIFSDFSRYQMRGKQLEKGNLRHEVELELMASRRNLFNSLVNQGLSLINSEEITNLLKDDIPKFLNDNQSNIIELAVKAIENPDINNINVSPQLVQVVVPLVIKAATTLLSSTPELTNIAKEVHELITAASKDRPQKVTDVMNSILSLKKNNKDLDNLIEKEIPELFINHSEDLGKVMDAFLNRTKVGKALNSRGKQIVEIVGKKLPAVKELAESYTKGDRIKLIPKALKLLFNQDVLRLVVDVAGDMARYALQKGMILDSPRALNSAKIESLLSESVSSQDTENKRDESKVSHRDKTIQPKWHNLLKKEDRAGNFNESKLPEDQNSETAHNRSSSKLEAFSKYFDLQSAAIQAKEIYKNLKKNGIPFNTLKKDIEQMKEVIYLSFPKEVINKMQAVGESLVKYIEELTGSDVTHSKVKEEEYATIIGNALKKLAGKVIDNPNLQKTCDAFTEFTPNVVRKFSQPGQVATQGTGIYTKKLEEKQYKPNASLDKR